MRICDGKQLGYIFLPIMLPDGVEFEEYSASSEYKQILRVIAALANQDERIVEQFQVPLLETDKPDKDKTKVVDFISYQITIDPEQLRQQIEVSISSFVGRKNYRSFEEAREYVHSLKITGSKAYKIWLKRNVLPPDIPTAPNTVYANKWNGWGDWFGTYTISTHVLSAQKMDFEEAREYVRTLKFRSQSEYYKWTKTHDRPKNIPADPFDAYKGLGWISWPDWLGNDPKFANKRIYKDFEEAKKFISSLNLSGKEQFAKWSKTAERPVDIPSNPPKVYHKTGWTSWGDFLGTETVATLQREYRSFNEARDYIRSLGLQNEKEFRIWLKSPSRPKDIPSNPHRTYKEDWINLSDFLGSDPKKTKRGRKFRKFSEARDYIRLKGFTTIKEYRIWSKSGDRPSDIPTDPVTTYSCQGWIDWYDWLGKPRPDEDLDSSS